MMVMPDNPENDPLDLYLGFYTIVENLKWSNRRGVIYKLSLIEDLLVYLCVQK